MSLLWRQPSASSDAVVRKLFQNLPPQRARPTGATSALWIFLRKVWFPFHVVALQIFKLKFVWFFFHAQWMGLLQSKSSTLEVLSYFLVPIFLRFLPKHQVLSNISLCKWFILSSLLWPTLSLSWPLTISFPIYLGLIFLPISVKLSAGSCPMTAHLH